MKYVGIDLHRQTISICVVNKERTVLERKRFLCSDVKRILAWFRELGEFEFVVEAMGTYDWLVELLEPLAKRWLLANPSKMRVIAQTAKKTDREDAQTLAEFLALGLIPRAYRPPQRIREHRKLVRFRVQCRQRVSRLKCQIRFLAATINADRPQLFEPDELQKLRQHPAFSDVDRFMLEQRLLDYEEATKRLTTASQRLQQFAQEGSEAEQEQRRIVQSAPGLGKVLSEVVLAELGDASRFGSLKEATAYAGLVPGTRESAGKGKELGITKQGSRLLRWAMVEAAWIAVRNSPRWSEIYWALRRRRGAKRAIVAVARRLLAVLVSMLKSGVKYRPSLAELKERDARKERRNKQRRAARAAAAAV
jgi:transposase